MVAPGPGTTPQASRMAAVMVEGCSPCSGAVSRPPGWPAASGRQLDPLSLLLAPLQPPAAQPLALFSQVTWAWGVQHPWVPLGLLGGWEVWGRNCGSNSGQKASNLVGEDYCIQPLGGKSDRTHFFQTQSEKDQQKHHSTLTSYSMKHKNRSPSQLDQRDYMLLSH